MTENPSPAPASDAVRRRRRRSRRRPTTGYEWLAQNVSLVGLLTLLFFALLSEMDWLPPAARLGLLHWSTLGALSLLLLGKTRSDLRGSLLRGPHPILIALLAWCVVTFFVSPFRAAAAAELMRLLLAFCLYLLAAYSLDSQQLRLAVWGPLLLGVAISLYDLMQFGAQAGGERHIVVSLFGNHEQQGSFLLLLFPIALSLGVRGELSERTRIGMQAVALVLGAALLLARTRAAWIGGVAALVSLLLLALLYNPLRYDRKTRHLLIGPLVVVVLAFTALVAMGNLSPLVKERASTYLALVDDTSFADRLHRWRSAARAVAERPVTGWGLGAWTVHQGRWTHQGDDTFEVRERGTGHINLAHNFWVQWAADTGAVGLALYVGALAAFLLSVGRMIAPVSSAYRRGLLMGVIATVVGAAVDAVGAPSYNYPGVHALLWFWIGIGVAACRDPEQAVPALPPARRSQWLGALGAGMVAALIVLAAGAVQLRTSEPRGTLTLTPESVADAPGIVRFSARFEDGNGKPQATGPGTLWTVTAGRLRDARAEVVREEGDRYRSPRNYARLQGTPDGPVTVTAIYYDRQGRRYRASATPEPAPDRPQ